METASVPDVRPQVRRLPVNLVTAGEVADVLLLLLVFVSANKNRGNVASVAQNYKSECPGFEKTVGAVDMPLELIHAVIPSRIAAKQLKNTSHSTKTRKPEQSPTFHQKHNNETERKFQTPCNAKHNFRRHRPRNRPPRTLATSSQLSLPPRKWFSTAAFADWNNERKRKRRKTCSCHALECECSTQTCHALRPCTNEQALRCVFRPGTRKRHAVNRRCVPGRCVCTAWTLRLQLSDAASLAPGRCICSSVTLRLQLSDATSLAPGRCVCSSVTLRLQLSDAASLAPGRCVCSSVTLRLQLSDATSLAPGRCVCTAWTLRLQLSDATSLAPGRCVPGRGGTHLSVLVQLGQLHATLRRRFVLLESSTLGGEI